MDGATAQLNLQIRVDGLREDLIFVCGNLKKNGYDFTMTLAPLLSEPASDELVQRITARLQSLQEKLCLVTPSHERPSGNTLKRPAVHVPVENPVPTSGQPAKKPKSKTLDSVVHGSDGDVDSEALPITGLFEAPHVAKTAMRAPSKKRKSQTVDFGSDGEVLPRKGLFAAFKNCRQNTIHEIESLAIWAFHVFRTYKTTVSDSKEWMKVHWELPGPTEFCTMYGKEELSRAPAIANYLDFVQNRYLQAHNIRAAADSNDLRTIQIGYLLRTHGEPDSSVHSRAHQNPVRLQKPRRKPH